MQKVVGSNPISRSPGSPLHERASVFRDKLRERYRICSGSTLEALSSYSLPDARLAAVART
jgi:hypothetical protein